MAFLDDVTNGLFVDFEGDRDTPAMLGVVWHDVDRDTVVYLHYILDPDLYPAAGLERGCATSTLTNTAVWLVLQKALGNNIYAWSQYEANRFRANLPDPLGEHTAGVITNAIPLAEPWMVHHHPDHASRRLKKGKRNALEHYFDASGYEVHGDAARTPMEGISLMRAALRANGGHADGLSADVRAAWRATLLRNFDDANGLRDLMIRVAS